MTRIDRNASLEEKLEHIMREIGRAGYEGEITAHALENIIAYSWGHNRVTIKMALDFLKSSKKVSRKNPKVYLINVPIYASVKDDIIEKSEDETAVEELFAAEAIEEDFKGMLRFYHDRHPKGMKGGPSQAQDMHWIGATKGRYGLQDMRDKDVYKKLQEGLA